MSFEPLEFLRHILVESDYLLAASAQVTREQFERDETGLIIVDKLSDVR